MKTSALISMSYKKSRRYTYSWWAKNSHVYFYNYILKRYNVGFSEGFRYYMNGYKRPKQCNCGKNIVMHGTYCSNTCKLLDSKGMGVKISEGQLKMYADKDSYDTLMEKKKKTSIERYGVEFSIASKEVREKINNTNLEKYGGPVLKNKKIQGKIKQTNIVKYGFENAMSNDVVKNKMFNTNLKKYGVKTQMQRQEVVEQRKEGCFKKYGVPSHLNLEETQIKIKQTNIEKYGVEFSIRKNISNKDVFENKDFIIDNFIIDTHLHIHKMSEFFNMCISGCYKHLKRLDIDYVKYSPVSSYEHEIVDFIKSISSTEVMQSYRDKWEIDVYLPAFNLGIEFNGMIYHGYSPGQYPCYDTPESVYRTKHINKTNYFEERGIQVLHIFENEWLTNKELWKSVIRTKLGLNERIFARKCVVKEVKNSDIRSFLEQNHLQGYTPAKINLGLFYQDELMSVMTFSKPRFNKAYDYELIRFCTRSGYTVVGAAAKLLAHFKKLYEGSIISYANRRWSNGNLYKNLGFELTNTSAPNYFYFKNSSTLHSRNEFQKHKLKDKLEIFDESLTESENMYNNGYWRIWDSGNKVYTL